MVLSMIELVVLESIHGTQSDFHTIRALNYFLEYQTHEVMLVMGTVKIRKTIPLVPCLFVGLSDKMFLISGDLSFRLSWTSDLQRRKQLNWFEICAQD